MEPKQLFAIALEATNGCVAHIQEDQLANATPCSEWDLRQLLNHLTYELLWVPDMLAGKTIDEVGSVYDGDVLGDDIQAAWRQAAAKAREAVETADLNAVVHTSAGDITADEYVRQMAGDVYIHGWDISQATVCSLLFDSAAAEALYQYYLPRADSWRAAGAFGAKVEVPDGAPVADRLLGLVGRTPAWAAAGA